MDKNLKFYEIRGHRVLHPELFTGDGFAFELTEDECSRYQFGTLNTGRGSNLKYLPFAFTETGVQVLNMKNRGMRVL